MVAVLVYLFAPAALPLLFTGSPAREQVTVGDDIPLPASPSCERDFGSGMLTGYKCGQDYVRSAEMGGITDPALAATRLWRAEVYLPTDNRPTTDGAVTVLRDGDTAVILAPTGENKTYTVAVAAGVLISPTIEALQAVNA